MGRIFRSRAVAIDTPRTTNERSDAWFWDHYEAASDQIITLVEKYGRPLAGATIADVGCGDGIIDLGLALRAAPARVVGFDVNSVDLEDLLQRATEQGVGTALPEHLEFRVSEPEVLPAPDASFDIVVTWSAFEHIANPLAVLREMRRICKPDGLMMLQLYPFYYSEHGSHLWDWYPSGFAQITRDNDTLKAEVRASGRHEPKWTEYMLEELDALNRITLDELGEATREAGFAVAYIELITGAVMLPAEVQHVPLSSLAIAGVKLLALPVS